MLGEKLLQLVLLVWTFDDIASGSAKADQYKQHAELTSGKDEIGCLTIAGQDVDFGLREACNEIFHGQEIRAVYDDAIEFSGDDTISKRWFCDGQVD